MIDPVPIDERRPPITPQLALRVAVLGGIAFVLFAIIFFRLWYLQVLSGDQYLQQARDNRVRELRVQAPRGDIVDRNGHVLVENRAATVVQLDPESLPAAERNAAATWGQQVTARTPPARRARRARWSRSRRRPRRTSTTRFKSLARVLNMSPQTIQERVVQSLASLPYANVTVKVDVDVPRAQLPRRAPRGLPRHRRRAQVPAPLPAALAGGPARRAASARSTTTELKLKRFKGVTQGTVVGQGGLERAYDQYLRGVDGSTKITIDALGRPEGLGRRATTRCPGARCARRSTSTCSRPARSTSTRRSTRARAPPAPSSRSTRATAACSRWAPIPTVNPAILSKPFSQATRRPPLRRQRRRAAVQPRDRRLLSDGLDLQADHGAGRA